MISKKDTEKEIVGQAIKLLSTEGSAGLTLRKVASNCGIRLSNLQYYYPHRTALVQAAVQQFFQHCEETLLAERQQLLANGRSSSTEFIRKLLDKMIICDPADQYSIVFREAWALAAHDKALAATMRQYYRNYIEWMADLISDSFPEAKKMMCILIPFAEGYSLMGDALPLSREKTVEMLSDMLMG